MKTLTFLMLCLPLFGHSTSTLEEGLILQEEMRFLEDSIQESVADSNLSGLNPQKLNKENDLNLEDTYFGGDEDEIRTRTAAPRRRR